MKKTIYIFIFGLIAFFLCISCNEEILENTFSIVERNVFSEMDRQAHGIISFEIQNGPYNNSRPSLGISFVEDTTNYRRTDGGTVTFEGVTFTSNHSDDYRYRPNTDAPLTGDFVKNLFGKELSFNISLNLDGLTERNSSEKVIQGTLFMPEMVELTRPSFRPGEIMHMNRREGLSIEWDANVNNPNLVRILITWQGVVLDDDTRTDYPQSSEILTFDVPDNGSYTIDENQLKALPPNAYISVFVMRGNVKTVQQENKIYQVKGRSVGMSYMVLE